METLKNTKEPVLTGQHCTQQVGARSASAPVSAFDKARTWLRLARDAAIVRRACGYAVVVGTVLVAINHGDATLAGRIDGRRLAKMRLTIPDPYIVSTFSSVGAIRALHR